MLPFYFALLYFIFGVFYLLLLVYKLIITAHSFCILAKANDLLVDPELWLFFSSLRLPLSSRWLSQADSPPPVPYLPP